MAHAKWTCVRLVVLFADVGVTAYMQKAVLRARPNEQFLRATIRNMQTGQPCVLPEPMLNCVHS